ncbi:MAG: hypothetical protein ACJ743_09825 [Gaiellaceae bacterium]
MKTLALIGTAVVVGAVTFVGSAVAKPTEGVTPLPAAVNLEQSQNQRLSSSEPVQQASGMTPAEYHALMVRSEGLNKKYGLGTVSLTLERGSNERFAGDNPTKTELVASTPIETSDGFAWDDAGIATGVLLAAMGVATAGIVGIRHHGRLGTS